MYGNGIIARKYEKNQVVKVRVELTANHMGFFEFRLCPNNNAKKPASQMCLDKNIMRDANSGDSRLGINLPLHVTITYLNISRTMIDVDGKNMCIFFEGFFSLFQHYFYVFWKL